MERYFDKKPKGTKTRIEYDNHSKQKIIKDFVEIEIDQPKRKIQSKIIIEDIEIVFPYLPYENQVIYMTKVIQALNSKSVAGLESPTGTGKTLCLLCACLGWLKAKRSQLKAERDSFGINDNDASSNLIPRIYYSSRTHSQLSNVIKELKKTCYLPKTAILSSRDNMCVHNVIKNFKGNALNMKCKQSRLRKECKYYYGAERLPYSSYNDVDIEELVTAGSKSGFCPFFYERRKKDDADIIFLPYNYIFEPMIKRTLKLKLANSILVIDEAHNIESVCEEAISSQLSFRVIDDVLNDLKAIKVLIESGQANDNLGKESVFASLNPQSITEEEEILSSIKAYLKSFTIKTGKFWPDVGLKLTPKELFDIFFQGSKGKDRQQLLIQSKPITGLNENNIDNHIALLRTIELGLSEELQKNSIIGEYILILEVIKLLSSNYLAFVQSGDSNPFNNFCNNYKFFLNDVEDASSSGISFATKKYANNKIRTLFLYCFNPGFGFKEILTEDLQSVIITSGTLSPIEGVESELKCNFGIKLENRHVVDHAQISLTILTHSISKKNIEFRFDNPNKGNVVMIEELGYTIVELSKLSPGGILVFFTSFSFMNICISLWADKEILSEIEKAKEIFKDMHDAQKNKVVLKAFTEANRNCSKGKGAIMFSVFRGTASEGIDFSDDYARMVILIGIPYPNLGDVRVQMKREFLSEFNRTHLQFIKDKSVKRLSGSEWYNQKATRTINQALGRVIRHINDYGSMVLLDVRFRDFHFKKLFSCWLRESVRVYYDSKILYDIKTFFEKMKTYIGTKQINTNQNHSKLIDQYETEFNKRNSIAKGVKVSLTNYNNCDNSNSNDINNHYCNGIGNSSISINIINIDNGINNENLNRGINQSFTIDLPNQKQNNINISTNVIKNGKNNNYNFNTKQILQPLKAPKFIVSDSPFKVNQTKVDVKSDANANVNESTDDVFDVMNSDELMKVLNDNFSFVDEDQREGMDDNNNKNTNINRQNIIDQNNNMRFSNNNLILLKSETKKQSPLNSSNKKIVKREPELNIHMETDIFTDNCNQIQLNQIEDKSNEQITPLKPSNLDSSNKPQSKEIRSELIIKKLLELKDRSELDSLLEKYNLKIDFDNEQKEKEVKKSITPKKRIECPVCFDNSQDNKQM